jgi:hypothetical protein
MQKGLEYGVWNGWNSGKNWTMIMSVRWACNNFLSSQQGPFPWTPCDKPCHRCSKCWLQSEMNTALNEPIRALLQAAGTHFPWIQPLVRAELLFSSRYYLQLSSNYIKTKRNTTATLSATWNNMTWWDTDNTFSLLQQVSRPLGLFRANADLYITPISSWILQLWWRTELHLIQRVLTPFPTAFVI